MATRGIRKTAGALAILAATVALTTGSAVAHPTGHRNSVVAGYVQICGGPSPGGCRREGFADCSAPNGCVSADRVVAVNSEGQRVAGQRLHHHRFRLHLAPGCYTIELIGDGKKVHGQVMEKQKVMTQAGRTTHIHFTFDVP